MNAMNWSAMLPEIMEKISDRLPVKDFLSLQSVCKTWQSLPSGRSYISKFSTDKLWLLLYDSHEDKCYLYSSIHSKACTFYLHDLKGATVMHSKFGWLIARKNEHFFLYNFFTLTKINLPDHAVSENQACTFTTLPLRKDCTVFIFTRKCDLHVEVSSCHVGDKKWEVESLDVKRSMINVLNAAMCCSCSPDGKSCTCTLRNRILVFSDEHEYMKYNYARNRVVCNATSSSNATSSRYGNCRYGNCCDVTEWEGDIKDLHKNEWIQRFGSEKGVAVRICSLSCKIGTMFGLKSDVGYFSASSESVPDYNFVKAAIIDTRYLRIEDVPE